MSDNNLLWKNLGTFWSFVSDDTKKIIEQSWEGLKEAVDDNYFRLYEIDDAKSLQSCPVYSSRRWMMLDLSDANLANINAAGDSLINDNKTVVTSKVDTDNNIYNTHRSILHKHFVFNCLAANDMITFPWFLDYTTVEIFKNDRLLQAVQDFIIVDNTIKFRVSGLVTIYVTADHTPNVSNLYKHRFLRQAGPKIDLGTTSDVNTFLVVDDTNTIVKDFTVSGNNIITNAGVYDVYWIEPEVENTFIEKHEHLSYEVIYNDGSDQSGSVSSIVLPEYITQVITSNAESVIRIFKDGLLYKNFSIIDNNVVFDVPLNYFVGTKLKIRIEWINVYPTKDIKNHRHLGYQFTNYQSPYAESVFDDGGHFDDGGEFDTIEEVPELQYPFIIKDSRNLRIWLSGVYLYLNEDYIIEGEKVKFLTSVDKKNIKITYFQQDRIYVYGYTNINYDNKKFEKINLGLFYDESSQYNDKNVEAPSFTVPWPTVTQINFDNTSLHSIPLILDGVTFANTVYKETTDYEIDNGVLLSDFELSKQSWCPLVYFDERLLANNFGALVGYEGASSLDYKAKLIAFFNTLWGGSTVQNLERAISILLGMPYITTSSKVIKIEQRLLSKTIRTRHESFTVSDTQLNVGDQVVIGQPATSKIQSDGTINYNHVMSGNVITGLTGSIGDIIKILGVGTFNIASASSSSITLDQQPPIQLGLIQSGGALTTGSDAVGTYLTGFTSLANVKSGMTITFDSSTEIILYVASDRVYVPASGSYSTYQIYMEADYFIFNNGSPFFTADGTIVNKSEVFGTYIEFENGQSAIVPSGNKLYLTTGDTVEPFQPLAIGCEIIDSTKDATWWINKAEEYCVHGKNNTTLLRRKLLSTDNNIMVDSTEGFPASGVVLLNNYGNINYCERIKYTSKTSDQFLGCTRGWGKSSREQYANNFDVGTTIQVDLEFKKDTTIFLANQIFRENVGNNFPGMEQYFPVFSPNVLIIKVLSTSGIDLSIISHFLNRALESSVRWYFDVGSDFIDSYVFSASEEISYATVSSGTAIVENKGTVLADMVVTPTGSAWKPYDLISDGITDAIVVKTITPNRYLVSYINGSFNTYSAISTVSGSSIGSPLYTPLSVNLNAINLTTWSGGVEVPGKLLIYDGDNSGWYTVTGNIASSAYYAYTIEGEFKQTTSHGNFEQFLAVESAPSIL